MIGHARRPDKVCETVWSLSESRGQGLEGGDVEDCRPLKGFSVSVNGGFV